MQKPVLLRGERNTSGQAAVSLAPESVQKFNGSKPRDGSKFKRPLPRTLDLMHTLQYFENSRNLEQ
jgi:hypothetical protein